MQPPGLKLSAIKGAPQTHVRFTPDSDRERETPQTVMSALPPKADMCAAVAMSAWPIADIPARPSKKII
jgi:hypothetical protein